MPSADRYKRALCYTVTRAWDESDAVWRYRLAVHHDRVSEARVYFIDAAFRMIDLGDRALLDAAKAHFREATRWIEPFVMRSHLCTLIATTMRVYDVLTAPDDAVVSRALAVLQEFVRISANPHMEALAQRDSLGLSATDAGGPKVPALPAPRYTQEYSLDDAQLRRGDWLMGRWPKC